MPVTQVESPPLLLHNHMQSVSGLELFLQRSSELAADPTTRLSVAGDLKHFGRAWDVTDNFNCYLFSQYVMYLYINIFVTPTTNQVYRDLLVNTLMQIRTGVHQNKITDRALQQLIRIYACGEQDARGQGFVDALRVVQSRLNPELAYPGFNNLLAAVCTIYDERAATTSEVTLFHVKLTALDQFPEPTLMLIPTPFTVTLTVGSVPRRGNAVNEFDLQWRFIHAFNITGATQSPDRFTQHLTQLASLALPLDPINLTQTLRIGLTENQKAGVPFLNYLAMYLRQRLLGYDYNLSRLADTRRAVMYQMHQFCGVGATRIADVGPFNAWMREIRLVFETTDPQAQFTENDYKIYRHLENCTNTSSSRMLRELNYSDGTEAAKSKPDDGAFAGDQNPDAEPAPKKTPKPATPPKDDPPAEDPPAEEPPADDPPADKPAQKPTDPAQSADDTIGQTGETDPQAPPPSTLLPLALPTETLDDHLYRLNVVRLVSTLDSVTDPGVTAETMRVLKNWCGSLMFIAAASVTRTLIAQLKLTNKLKELSA